MMSRLCLRSSVNDPCGPCPDLCPEAVRAVSGACPVGMGGRGRGKVRSAECGIEQAEAEWDETAEFEYDDEKKCRVRNAECGIEETQERADVRHFYGAEGMDPSHTGPPYPTGSDGEVYEGDPAIIPHSALHTPHSKSSAFHAPHSDGSAFRIPQSALFLASLRRRSVYDLERDINGYGREIWVESRYNDGRPSIWYEFDSKGRKIRRERDAIGINLKTLGPGPYL